MDVVNFGFQEHDILQQKYPFRAAGFITLPETNIGPKIGWLKYYFPDGEAYFQGLC